MIFSRQNITVLKRAESRRGCFGNAQHFIIYNLDILKHIAVVALIANILAARIICIAFLSPAPSLISIKAASKLSSILSSHAADIRSVFVKILTSAFHNPARTMNAVSCGAGLCHGESRRHPNAQNSGICDGQPILLIHSASRIC